MPGSGTDHTKEWTAIDGPVIVLVEPQLGENIGTAARAMANFGLSRLRLVKPRDGWPNIHAKRAASGADMVLENAELFDSVEAAIRGDERALRSARSPRAGMATELKGGAAANNAAVRRKGQKNSPSQRVISASLTVITGSLEGSGHRHCRALDIADHLRRQPCCGEINDQHHSDKPGNKAQRQVVDPRRQPGR